MFSPPPPTGELVKDFFPFIRVYKDGRVERFLDSPRVPPPDDPITGVRSKDVIIQPENKVGARLFLPTKITSDQKLPILIYIHGGGFVIESAFSSIYTNYLNKVVAEAQVLAVSVEYRLAPEHPVPACYDDAWTVMKWLISHATEGKGIEPWISIHGDFNRIFLAGDSAGANIAHNLMARASVDGLDNGVKLAGMALVHPYFGIGGNNKMWEYISPDSTGVDDPRLRPMTHPDILAGLNCGKIMIFVAEKDILRESGWVYYEAMKKSGWGGVVEIKETEGEEHVFHLMKPSCEKAGILLKHFVSMFSYQ